MENKSPGILIKPFLQLFLLAGILTFAFFRLADAQTQNVRFDHLTSDNGLSQNSVLCISQDSKGFMWFGTYEGLNRYDGYEFKIYKSEIENPHSLCNNAVQYIYKDHNGNLWIGTDNGLDRFDRATDGFIHYKNDPNDPTSLSSNRIRWMCEDQSGGMWVGTNGGGLNQFDSVKNTFIRYQNNPLDPNSISNNIVSCVYVDKSGTLWVATDGGVNRFDRARNRFIHYRHDPKNPHSIGGNNSYRIIEDRFGVLWFGIWNGGLDQYDQERDQFIHYKNRPGDSNSLSSDVVRSIYEDRSGTLWIGTWGGGVNKFDRKNNRFIRYQSNLNNPNSLSNNSVISIYEDRSGILWFGNEFGGINKYDHGKIKFSHYKKESENSNGLNYNTIYSLAETIDGGKKILWIGTQTGGLNKYDHGKNKFTYYKSDPKNPLSLSDNNIRVILASRTGSLWIGTNRGLNQFDRAKETFTRYLPDPNNPNSLSNNDVFSLCEDRSGSVWIGTYGGGLNQFDPKTKKFTRYTADPKNPNSLSDNYIWSIVEDHSGVLWVGTENSGLNQFDREHNRFIHYRADPKDPSGLSSNKILCLLEDHSGILWIGTTEGLNKFDKANKRFSRYLVTDGLPSNAIQSILEDTHGNLWLGTQKGLSKFDPQHKTFKNFKVSDGLQGNEFCVNACFKSRYGDMYFGGINGFNTFSPDSIKDNPYIPSIVIEDFQIFNTSVPVGKEIDGNVILGKSIIETKEINLSYKENVFSFEFASLHLASPKENKYAYMMEGFDKGWNYTSAERRFAMYTNMSAGEYVFRVKGSNSDGVWNETGTSIHVIITPPYWLTLWFRLILLAVFLGIIYWIYKWRVQARDIVAGRQMQAALTKERNLLRTLIDNLPDAVFVKDLECRKIIANPVDVRTMGAQSEAEVIGKTDDVFFSAETAATSFAEDQSVLKSGLPILGREGSYFDKQGNKVNVLSFKMPLRDEHGTIVGIVGATHDITEQKRSQEVLQQERTILRTLIDNIPEGIYIKDSQCRKVIANLADVHNCGFESEQQIIGKDDFELFPRKLAEGFYADDLSVIQTGQPIINREENVFDKQGQKRWLLTTKIPLRDDKGQIIGLVGIGRDVTEHKLAEEALRQERNLLRTLIDLIPDYIYLKDTDSRFILANKALIQSFRKETIDEIYGKTDSDFHPIENAREYFADEQEIIRSGQPLLSKEELVVEATGKRKWNISTKLPFRDPQGKVVGLVGTGHDITERKLVEEALRQKTALLEAQLNSSIDGVLVVDNQGKKILQNQRTIELWKIPKEIADNPNDQMQVDHVMHLTMDPDQFVDQIKYLYSHPNETSRDEVELKDGTVLDRYSAPVVGSDGRNYGRIWSFHDITERKKAEAEREKLITELQEAVADVKTLSGLVPICSSCKKIRDDKGYWTQLEGYIQAHSQAKFSHGVCPDCMVKLYPNYIPKKKE